MSGPGDVSVRSVERAVAILDYLARSERPAPLRELSEAIHAPKSTTLNIARTLAARRLLRFDVATKAYGLGGRLGEFAPLAHQDPDICAVARPYLERLSRETGEGAFLSVREGDQIVYVDKVESTQPIRYAASVGGRRPLHCTSAGKVALAMSPPGALDRYLERGLTRHTPSTVTDAAVLRREIARVRHCGYAEALGEYVPDLVGIAAPVVGPAGELVAVVTVAGPAFRVRGHRREMRAMVTGTARKISLAYARAARC